MKRIRPETTGDHPSVREVHRQAFGREKEGRLVDSLRDGGFSRLSLVAEQDGLVVGHILFSEVAIVIDHGSVPALALAPLAVVPERQRRGLGSMLVRKGLRLCGDSGHRIVIVLGIPSKPRNAPRQALPHVVPRRRIVQDESKPAVVA
ncbi:MAG: GNAT family N-acetyltransferase [Isosphaerales bacterium]